MLMDIDETIAEHHNQREYLCPNCRSNRIAPSHGLFDWLLRFFGSKPYWCDLCNTRFYVQDIRHATG